MSDTGVQDLSQTYVDAELHGDVDALDDLLTDDFRAVGPLGFIVDKQRWLDRYRTGELENTTITWNDVEARVHGDAAIVIGRWDQQSSHQGNAVNGTFRVTQTFVHDDGRWRLAGVQLSPIAQPPVAS
jgi:ketosteroid isomerase-like protein